MLGAALTVALAATQVIVLEPGVSLAGIKLGAPEAALARQGLRPRPGANGWYQRGPQVNGWPELTVRVENGQVVDIDATIGPHTRVDWGKGPGPEHEDYVALARRFGRCGPIDHRIGGSWIPCEAKVAFVRSMAGSGIRLMVDPVAPAARCDAYAEGPGPVDVPSEGQVCLGTLVLTRKTTLASIEASDQLGFCETVRDAKGATRRCRGTLLLFDLAGTLRRIEIGGR